MADFLRDTPVGQIIRHVSGGRVLAFPEEATDFNLQEIHIYAHGCEENQDFNTNLSSHDIEMTANGLEVRTHAAEDPNATSSSPIAGQQSCSTDIIITFRPSDPLNPHNWPISRKLVVHVTINYWACAIYLSSSVFVPSMLELPHLYGISHTISSPGLALFVFGYGFGPLIMGPISEIPSVGRNKPYLLSLLLYLVISVPTALAKDIASLMTLRFLQGFFGSPVFAIGGGSLSDVTGREGLPYALYIWAITSFVGPAIGPVISGYTVPSLGWRISLWEILWMCGPALVMVLLLPETSAANILHRRAQRLRRRLNNPNFKSQPEIDASHTKFSTLLYKALLVPWKVNALDPSILFTSLYCGLVYAIFYLFFEVFPFVYMDMLGMSAGEMGLVFLSVPISVALAGVPYCLFTRGVNSSARRGKSGPPERRLKPALFASTTIPFGLFLFAWTARPGIHWTVPTLGVMLASSGMAIIFQSIFVYIMLAYPQYAASLLGGNGFVKASVAAGAIVLGRTLYEKLGIPQGTSLLGGLCLFCVAGIFTLYRFGETLRRRSRFAHP